MGGLAAGMDDDDARQFEFPVNRHLFVDGLFVALDKRVAEVRHVLVLASVAVHGVDDDPRAAFLVRRPHGLLEARAGVLLQGREDFRDGLVVCPLRGDELAVALKRVGAVGDVFVRLEEGGQVFAEFRARVPLGRLGDDFGFQPVLVHDAVFVRVHHLVPADGVGV